MPTNVWITASRALMPRSGAPAACDALPWNTISTRLFASEPRLTMFVCDGCSMKAASTSSKTPASASRILPPPPSSAGVPTTRIVPGKRTPLLAMASPAPSALVAMTLWPQAWPMPGQRVVLGQDRDSRAGLAAAEARPGTPSGGRPAPRSTVKPPCSNSSARRALARCSRNASSGLAWMSWLDARSCGVSSSTAARIRASQASRSIAILDLPPALQASIGVLAPPG